MTREEAIIVLKYGMKYRNPKNDTEKDRNEALDMAISALKQYDGMTNGEVIQALFPQIELAEIHNGRHRFFLKGRSIFTFDLRAEVEWLNAPYKAEKGGEE